MKYTHMKNIIDTTGNFLVTLGKFEKGIKSVLNRNVVHKIKTKP
jgi:hypothetical protein